MWIAVLVVFVQVLHRFAGTVPEQVDGESAPDEDRHSVDLTGLGILLALAFAGFWMSERLAAWTAELGFAVPAMLILTTIALLAAQVPLVQRVGGSRMLGTFGAYLFIAVIGACCDIEAVSNLGSIGGLLLLFVAVVLLVHGLIQFGLGRMLRLSPEVLAIASSANVGGAMTIMPTASGVRRMDLLLPGILVGTLGNAVGTYAGFMMVGFLHAVPSPISAAHAVAPTPVQIVTDCTRPTYAAQRQGVCPEK